MLTRNFKVHKTKMDSNGRREREGGGWGMTDEKKGGRQSSLTAKMEDATHFFFKAACLTVFTELRKNNHMIVCTLC